MLGGCTSSRILDVIGQGAQHLLLEGSTLYYGPNSSGGFTLSLAPVDGQSGLAAVGFPALFGQDAALLNAAPYQVSYDVDPGLDMSGYYTLSAADRVGNQASSPQFRLVKDSAAPTAAVFAPAQPALAFRVNWQGQDSQAGVDYYDLQYREKEAQDWSDWLDWQTGTQETSARFVGQAGYEYQFRVRAADRVGNLGEWVTGSLAAVQNVTIYYYAGSVRVAMRQGERVTYLLADHLGSTQVTADEQGSELGRYLYTAWGETRQVSGESATDRLYTGQRQEAEIGLYYYNARFYDPALGRFVQADTVIPGAGNPQAWDRYAYVYNNPINFVDLNGHEPWFIDGWSQDYMFTQQGNTCAVVAITVSLSILTGHAYQQADIQPMFPHTYDFNIPLPGTFVGGKFALSLKRGYSWVTMNIAPGVMPLEQEIVTNAMFPGQIQATFTQGSRADLMDNLHKGCPTIITIALPWPGVGHALVVVGYDPDTNELQFFNPAYGAVWPESDVVSFYGDGRGITAFEELWAQSNSVIPGYSMMTMSNAPSLPLISSSPNPRGGGDRRPINNFW